ncbi:MAG: hypothetical protein OXF50_16910 [Caldilineaceae bacterium]|nr:hypothetical protein [Caldilineaceae bacterium]
MSKECELRWALFFAYSEGRNRAEPNFPTHEYWHPDKQTAISEGKRVLKELLSRGNRRDWYAGIHYDPFKVNVISEANTVTRISIRDVA